MSGGRGLVDVVMGALELEGAARAAYLEAVRAEDAALGEEAARLVARHERGRGGLESVAGATLVEPKGSEEGPGTRLGPYKLLQQIGEGGFGTVYLAEQESPVRRRVALKIIKLGMDTRAVIGRFEAERQALAVMDHAHIAKVLDAGATGSGRPYFVMELVVGDPITRFCDRERLTIAERLALFGQVCAAVQHAHQKGIIHRDLKPSNVLVSRQDGRPFARVIDFGIAKATGARLTEKTVFTEHRAMIGTPEYMSPEQAEGSPDLDTRTDVYSLGVLLYELLTGGTPFEATRLRSAAYAEIERIIREEEPERPSTRLSRVDASLASVAASRGVEPSRLGGMVRGELDWIVMKALEKDRGRRYESPAAMGADVLRHLSGEAVVAAPASRAYRARKFVRKHRAGVATGVMVGASLVVGLGLAVWQAGVASDERDLAREAEREQGRLAEVAEKRAEEAAREAARSKAVAAFLRSMLEANKPELAQGEELTVAQVLDRATARIRTELVDEPAVRAELLEILGSTNLSLGRVDQAGPVLREALVLAESLYPKVHLLRADILKGLWMVEFAEEGANAEARVGALTREAYEIKRELLGEQHPETLDAMGPMLQWQQYASAEPAQRGFVAMLGVVSGGVRSPAEINEDLESSVARCDELWLAGDREGAKRMAHEFFARYALADGAAERAATAAAILAESLASRGYPGAVRAIVYAAIDRQVEQSGPVGTGAFGVLAVGERALMKIGAFGEAADLGIRALAAAEGVMKPDNRMLYIAKGNTGEAMMKAGRFAEAEKLHRELLEPGILEGRLRAVISGRHGSCLLSLGRVEEAAAAADATLAMVEAIKGPPDLFRSTYDLLARVAAAKGDSAAEASWRAKWDAMKR